MAGNQILGRIYKLTSGQTDKVYIGSTTRTINRRFTEHRRNFKLWMDGHTNYVTSVELCKFDDCKVELIYQGLFDSKKDLLRLEGEYIGNNNDCVNKAIAGRTLQEYEESRRDKHNEWKRIKETCTICNGHYSLDGKARHLKTIQHQKAVSESGSSSSDRTL